MEKVFGIFSSRHTALANVPKNRESSEKKNIFYGVVMLWLTKVKQI